MDLYATAALQAATGRRRRRDASTIRHTLNANFLPVKPSRRRKRLKLNPAISERTVAPGTTLREATPIAAAKGVTRLADITGLDRLGIPIHSAIVPLSEDGISISNGKGLTAIDSRTSALMEAIERQTALDAEIPIVEASYRKLRQGRIAVADPKSFTHKLSDDYTDDREYWWTQGHDLLSDEPVLVPAGLAGYGRQYTSESSPHQVNASNGLASGNCFEEALCHALCELIERDAWTLAELRSQWIPLAHRHAVFGPEIAALGADDPDAYPLIDFNETGEPLSGLMEKFKRASLSPVVRDITSDFGIPCVIASVADDSVPDFPQAHSGTGAHPNACIAVVRALTELAQSRAVDIQGVREDIMPAGVPVHPAERKTQRVRKIHAQRWMLQQAGIQRRLAEINSFENDDVADDIFLILSRLERNGIERVIVVDLSEPGSPFAVVRVLVPGLEFWALDEGRIGARAVAFWRQHI